MPRRSRGGLTTKIYIVVDGHGSRSGSVDPRQAHGSQIADVLLDHLGPHTIVLADKADDGHRIRELIRHAVSRITAPSFTAGLKKLSNLTKFSLAPPADRAIVSDHG